MTELSPDHGKNQVQKKSTGIEYLSSLVTSNSCQERNSQHHNSAINPQKSHKEEDTLKKLRQLLMITSENSEQDEEIKYLNKRVSQLERSIPDPHKLLEMLAPIINQKLSFSLSIDVVKAIEKQIKTNPEELEKIFAPLFGETIKTQIANPEIVTQALAPIIDQVIHQRSQENQSSMSSVLAPVVTQAIAQQIQNSPHEVADVLAPEMAAAIRKQVKLKSDAMVDALYPVIGSTISTAIAETMREINTKVEKAFSPEAITRKIRARIQGVSDAELLLAETMPFKVRAIFLIHKSTGLLIAEVQQSGQQALEPEMIAGMLTAIRSFVGEYLSQSDHTSEIDEINYGNSKISLEVAGSCYLATVIDGEPTKAYRQQLRRTFSQIIQDYGDAIEVYTGDSQTIPEDITLALQNTITIASEPLRKGPPMLAVLASLLLGAIAIPWGIGFYHNQVEAKVEKALFATPELSVYPVEAQVGWRKLKLEGRVPDETLRSQAEKIANSVVPKLAIENNIISVKLPQLPSQVAVNVATVQTIFNQREDININAQYQGNRVEVTGSVLYPRDLKDISQTFAQVPGVKSVINSVQVKPLTLPIKVYFRSYSSQLKEIDVTAKISPIKEILHIYPDTKVTIFGYSDPDQEASVELALERAEAVKRALESVGINSSRSEVRGENRLPPKVSKNESNWLRRTAIVTLEAQ